VLAVSDATPISGGHAGTALVAYTTSQRWLGSTLPQGVFVFDQRAAAGLGQARAFVMDLRRLAAIPLTREWFPRLDLPGKGIQGHMPKKRQVEYARAAEDLLTRHSQIVERLGPDWPGGRS
jgi:hypothetical protein